MKRKITLDGAGASGGADELWFDSVSETFYADEAMTAAAVSVPVPALVSHRFGGYYTQPGGRGTKVTLSTGAFKGEFYELMAEVAGDVTVYAKLTRASWKVAIDRGLGSGGTAALYCPVDGGGVYADDLCTLAAESIALPSLKTCRFGGVYTGPGATGTKLVNDAGGVKPAFGELALHADAVTYVAWIPVSYVITLDKGGGEGGTDELYYRIDGGGIYADDLCTQAAADVVLASLECHAPKGYVTEPGGDVKYVATDGRVTDAFRAATFSGPATLYAKWARVSWRIAVDPAGGSGGTAALYCRIGGGIYEDGLCTREATSLVPPTRPECHALDGFYGFDGPEQVRYVRANGTFKPAFESLVLEDDFEIAASWVRQTWPVDLDRAGGGGGPDRLYRRCADDDICLDDLGAARAVRIETPVLRGHRFVCYYGGDREQQMIDAGGNVLDRMRDTRGMDRVTARWEQIPYFGRLTDYFGLGSEDGPLMLVASSSGAARTVVRTSHNGPLDAISAWGLLLNPVCTYRIRRAGSVAVRLGAAWRGQGASQSGYMLVRAEYATGADAEPVLVVTGAANEGADAINVYGAAIAVSPDHVAQDPEAAVTGGGELTECRTLYACDPVVPFENGMPCASDVVRGKVAVSATTQAFFGEDAPAARAPFVATEGPVGDGSDTDYETYAITAERSL